MTLDEALDRLSDPRAVLLVNERSGRAAVQVPAPSLMLDDGEIERRVRLIRPMEQHSVPLKMMAESHWGEADRERFAAAWEAELARGAGVHRQHDPYRRRPAAADLEAAAERVRRASTGFRPMPASASSAARSRQPGSRTRLRPARRR